MNRESGRMPSADDGWGPRATRARQLAARWPASAELLVFAAGLAEVQRSIAGGREAGRDAGQHLAGALDRDAVVAAIPDVTAWLSTHAPTALALAAASMSRVSAAEWRQRLDAWIDADCADDPHVRVVIEATVQPFAEIAAASTGGAELAGDSGRTRTTACPFCARDAALATLREAGHGARRSLQCALCLTEWPIARVGCAACGETGFDRLPVFSAAQFPHARVDACESCRSYVKTIDITRDGHAVPIIDDLATLPLDLWAAEQGYRRWRPHLFGV